MNDPLPPVPATAATGAAEDGEPQTRRWALYAYLCGDNPTLAQHTAVQIEAIKARGGSNALHVAVQWDLPDGAARAVAGDNGGWSSEERLGRRNTGEPEELAAFLIWAFERCPATHVIVVLSGTGLLDPRASIGRPDTDRSRIFTVLDDTTERDALALASLRPTLRRVLETASRDQIDIVAFDVRELQFLEVAYELEGLAEVLIAPQTRVPDHGWDFGIVLDACATAVAADAGLSALTMGRLLVETVGTLYQRSTDGALSVSALDLTRLNDVADAFDTMCLAMLHSVGDEMVWEARDQVFKKLRPLGADAAASGLAADAGVLLSESDWLYDLFEMLSYFDAELQLAADQGLARQIVKLLKNQDVSQLLRSLRAIQSACFVTGSHLRVPELRACIADPPACRRGLRRVIRAAEALLTTGGPAQREKVDRAIEELFTRTGVPADRCSWLDGWPDLTVELLPSELAREYRTGLRSQTRTRQLAQLTARVVRLLRPAGGLPGAGEPATLVYAHFSSPRRDDEPPRHFGVSLFRPRELDYLVASDYLQLKFNERVHWTALMAVINLIGRHPRALWRVLSAVLATADQGTRSELLSRISGPDSVLGSFRQQFSVLAPLSALVLSLEQNVAVPRRSAIKRRKSVPASTRNQGMSSYRVRLERAGRDPLIEEAVSVVNQRTIDQVLSTLVALLNRSGPATPADVHAIEALGRSLGEDILQRLGHTLGEAAKVPAVGGVHLQLQIPRPLMPYPWELMQYRGGWLSEHFALGRQVFASRGVPRTRSRVAGPLRALVVGNPTSTARSLNYGQAEAERVAGMLERLRDETDGLVDFDRTRDARINQPLTGLQLRDMLRQRQYDIIHFAGHASFAADQPENSAWMLSDGPLSAQSLSNTLDWCDSAPWLVFANACEAGMDAEHPEYQGEVFGLASAFLMQGVGAYIAPLWPIDDAVAADVATVFYEKLLKDRETVGESLRQARVAAKRKYYDGVLGSKGEAGEPTGAPGISGGVALVSWAGMILYGSSTTTVGQRVGAPATG